MAWLAGQRGAPQDCGTEMEPGLSLGTGATTGQEPTTLHIGIQPVGPRHVRRQTHPVSPAGRAVSFRPSAALDSDSGLQPAMRPSPPLECTLVLQCAAGPFLLSHHSATLFALGLAEFSALRSGHKVDET